MPRTADEWFDDYGQSHKNPINKTIHWICIPLIMISLIGLLWSIPSPFGSAWINWGSIFVLGAFAWYLTINVRLAAGMAVVGSAMVAFVGLVLAQLPIALWLSSTLIFVGAWIFQFIGHKIEGKKPSFFKDLQFLLVGPMWLLGFIYRSLGVAY